MTIVRAVALSHAQTVEMTPPDELPCAPPGYRTVVHADHGITTPDQLEFFHLHELSTDRIPLIHIPRILGDPKLVHATVCQYDLLLREPKRLRAWEGTCVRLCFFGTQYERLSDGYRFVRSLVNVGSLWTPTLHLLLGRCGERDAVVLLRLK